MTSGSGLRPGWAHLALGLFLAAFVVSGLSVAAEPLTVRVQDAIAAPGGIVGVVLRTYASRPIGQGQLCLMATPVQSPESSTQTPTPLGSLIGAVVFSDVGDARVDLVTEVSADPQMIMIQFTADSGTVNLTDGPLGVLFFRLDESVLPGSRFRMMVDVPNSTLRGPDGGAIVIEAREGELATRLPAGPFLLQADGTRVVPGQVADLAVSTLEPFLISEGQIGLRYDPTVAGGIPQVRMDPRHGNAVFDVDASVPGTIIVNFSSPMGDLNYLPGDLIQINLPTSARAAPDGAKRLWLDPAMTWVAGPSGLLPLTLEDDQVEFLPQSEGGGRGKPIFVEIEQSATAWPSGARSISPGQSRLRDTTRGRR